VLAWGKKEFRLKKNPKGRMDVVGEFGT